MKEFQIGPFVLPLGTVTENEINDLCSSNGAVTKLTNEYWAGLKRRASVFRSPTTFLQNRTENDQHSRWRARYGWSLT